MHSKILGKTSFLQTCPCPRGKEFAKEIKIVKEEIKLQRGVKKFQSFAPSFDSDFNTYQQNINFAILPYRVFNLKNKSASN